MNSKDVLGLAGERLAEKFLRASGLKIIARRFRTRAGEIDLIAMDGDEVVFVEVKTRRSGRFGTPEESVTRTKRAHLRAVAFAYLSSTHRPRARFRIDVVAIEVFVNESPRITHIRSAVGDED